MLYSKVIIIGGGPAGSTCGWKLKQASVDCLILDKKTFPRPKLCAGWITPQVVNDLKIDIKNYANNLATFNKFYIHVYNKNLKVKVHQFSIRRYEFDNWLLKRSGVPVDEHEVKNIRKDGEYYIIDDQYRCKYLVGAGGTHCPVYQIFFKQRNPRAKNLLVTTLEQEFAYNYEDSNCHLWFAQNTLPGYSWYVPKEDGYLNVGIGGFAEKLKKNGDNIKRHWQLFVKQLEELSLVKNYQFNPKGAVYYIRDKIETAQMYRAFVIGDAAGLATKDMGEGIAPAVESGLLAADAIILGKQLSLNSVKKYSFQKYRTIPKLLFSYFTNIRSK